MKNPRQAGKPNARVGFVVVESKQENLTEIITMLINKSILITAVIAFFLGAATAGKLVCDAKDKRAAQLAAEQQAQQVAFKDEVRRIEQDNAKRLADALAERDKALAVASADHARADQLRKQSDQLSAKLARLSATPADPSNPDAIRAGCCERLLAEASGLLAEGAGLAAEGGQLSARLSADRDAIAKIINARQK